jgi:plastocyanin
MRQMSFVPAELEIHAGDTVVWINRDIVPHTATAEDRSWTTGQLAGGDSALRVISGNPTGAYYCALHPAMQARLVTAR